MVDVSEANVPEGSQYSMKLVPAIGILAAASLLLELAFVRVFAVLFFYHYSFMIISTALFGLGVSGIILHLRGLPKNGVRAIRNASILFAVTSILAMLFTYREPVRLSEAIAGQTKDLVHLLVFYIVLGTPFYFVGRAISVGLSTWSEKANVLYFGDLVGAGLGCLGLFVALPIAWPMGVSFVVGALALAAALLLTTRQSGWMRVFLGIGILAFLICAPWLGPKVHFNFSETKREFRLDMRKRFVEWSEWGVLSRVDVAKEYGNDDRKTVWIEGGSNESHLVRFGGDFEKDFDKAVWGLKRISLVYQLRDPGRVVIIGVSGSSEAVAAAGFGATSVTGVEMDSLIVRLVTQDYADYIGRPYDNPHIRMVCEEGRSYLERTQETFDIIQQINNFTPVAMSSGALNVSETYLVTVEAMQLFLKRLSDQGIIDFYRHGDIRVASVAMEAMRRNGIAEPWKHIVILDDETFIKKTPWTPQELDRFRELVDQYNGAKSNKIEIRFIPDRETDPNGWYDPFLRSSHPEEWYHRDVANLTPSTDDWPFFNRYMRWGVPKDPTIPKSISIYHMLKVYNRIPRGDFILLCILAEATLLSFLFILLPMGLTSRRHISKKALIPVSYFACLGMGFIFVEICLMQRLTLLLGHPSLSLAVVLASLLFFAGVGSLISGKWVQATPRHLRILLLIIVGLLCVSAFSLQPVVRFSVGLPGFLRFFLAILISALHGLLLGMPFPVALRIMTGDSKRLIPWGWAMNSYATVIGSVLCVIVAMASGFRVVYLLSAGIYLLAVVICPTLAPKEEGK